MKTWLLYSVGVLCVVGTVQMSAADTIWFKTGCSLEGIILEESDGQIVFKQGPGSMTLRKDLLEKYEYSSSEDNSLMEEVWKKENPYTEEYAPPQFLDLVKLFRSMKRDRISLLAEKRGLERQISLSNDAEIAQLALEKELKAVDAKINELTPVVRERSRKASAVEDRLDNLIQKSRQSSGLDAERRKEIYEEYYELKPVYKRLLRVADEADEKRDALVKRSGGIEAELSKMRKQSLKRRDARARLHGLARSYLKKVTEFRATFSPYATSENKEKYPDFFCGISAELEKMESDIQTDVVTLKSTGDCVEVAALLNGKVNAVFILDTGASSTTISEEIARKLGICLDDKLERESTLADGSTAFSRLVTLDLIEVGNASLRDFEVAVYEKAPGDNVDGLLGMNFLRQFDYDINPEYTQITLTRLAE